MFEVRVKDGQWYLDAFVNSAAGSKALIDPKKLHPDQSMVCGGADL